LLFDFPLFFPSFPSVVSVSLLSYKVLRLFLSSLALRRELRLLDCLCAEESRVRRKVQKRERERIDFRSQPTSSERLTKRPCTTRCVRREGAEGESGGVNRSRSSFSSYTSPHLPNPPHITSYATIDLSSGYWARSQTLTTRNHHAGEVTRSRSEESEGRQADCSGCHWRVE
jgi:hypothetical protein